MWFWIRRPPGCWPDSAGLTRLADGTLYVLRSGAVEMSHIVDSLQFLSETGYAAYGLRAQRRADGTGRLWLRLRLRLWRLPFLRLRDLYPPQDQGGGAITYGAARHFTAAFAASKGGFGVEERPRQIDARTYLPVLMELLDQGRQVTLTVTGGSMAPFLVHGRDAICFSRPKERLRRGDMAFFRRADGSYIMHRVCRVSPEGYFLVGDAQQAVEGPVRRNRYLPW